MKRNYREFANSIDIYWTRNISENWKTKKLGQETIDVFNDILEPVAYRTQQMCFNKYGFKMAIQSIHKQPLCEDLFQRTFERALMARELFDPSYKVPMDLYIRMSLKFTDESLENWDAPVTPTPWARRRLFKVRDRYPMDKDAQRKAWIKDGGDGLEFDVLDSANWCRVHTAPFPEFDGGEVGWLTQEVADKDAETHDEAVIRKSQLESVAAFMQKLEDEKRDIDRQILMSHYEGHSAPWIVGKLGLTITPRSLRRTIQRLQEEAREYCNPTLFDTGEQ